jgi:uncharacterized protein YuzE
MIKEHHRVVLKKSLAGQGLKAGDVGTVIHVYKAGEAFEVEFLTLHGKQLPLRPWKVRRFVRCKKEKSLTRACFAPSSGCFLGPVKLFDKKDVPLDWEYDGDADTLYISFGKPKPALGVDVGDGVIVRYDEKAREVVGLTLIGVGKRMEEYIRKNP